MAKVGQLMAGFVQGQAAEESGSLPGLKIFPRAAREAKAAALPVLALEDKKEESDVRREEAPVVAERHEESKPTGAVAATLEALQVETKKESTAKAKAKSKGKKKGAIKKPASKAVLKRPSASSRTLASTEAESKAQRRLRLIDTWVPPEEQRKWKNGCARCYHRPGCTLSCWRKRGFAMTD